MSLLYRLISVWGLPFQVVLLLLLARTGLYKLCLSWTTYLAVTVVTTVLVVGWPARFWNWEFWMGSETALMAIKLLMALELAIRAFRGFAGAGVAAHRAVLVGCLAILGALVAVRLPAGGSRIVAGYLWTWAQNGIAAVLMALWILAVWYRIVLHPIYRAILRGLVIYLVVSTALIALRGRFPDDTIVTVGVLNSIAWTGMICYWLWTVWVWRAVDRTYTGAADSR